MRQYERLDYLKRCQKIKCSVDIIYSQYSFKILRKGHFLFLDKTLNEIVLL